MPIVLRHLLLRHVFQADVVLMYVPQTSIPHRPHPQSDIPQKFLKGMLLFHREQIPRHVFLRLWFL